MMKWLNPYIAGAAGLVLLVLLGVSFGYGRKAGIKAQAKADAPVIEQLLAANNSLDAQVRESAVALKQVSAYAEMERARAAQQTIAGAQEVAAARDDAKAAQARLAALERNLQRERSTCPAGEARICGVPLR